jgi:hypothetical protein
MATASELGHAHVAEATTKNQSKRKKEKKSDPDYPNAQLSRLP